MGKYPPPLPEAFSTAGRAAASAAGARCPLSTGWLESCHLQRGGLPSGTFPSGPHSPAWGAARSPPTSSSAPASICFGKAAAETWPSGSSWMVSVAPGMESPCLLSSWPVNTVPFPQGAGGEWKRETYCSPWSDSQPRHWASLSTCSRAGVPMGLLGSHGQGRGKGGVSPTSGLCPGP